MRAKEQLLQLTAIDNKILTMNINGLQSNMGLALYVTEAEKKTKQKNKTTHTKPKKQQPTQKTVPDPIYK